MKKDEKNSKENEKNRSTSAIEDSHQQIESQTDNLNDENRNDEVLQNDQSDNHQLDRQIEQQEDDREVDQLDNQLDNQLDDQLDNQEVNQEVNQLGESEITLDNELIEECLVDDEQSDDLSVQRMSTTHLLIPVSELEKLKNTKSNKQPPSTITKSAMLIQQKQQQLSPSIGHQRKLANQTSLLKQTNLATNLVAPIQKAITSTVSRPNQTLLKVQSPSIKQINLIQNSSFTLDDEDFSSTATSLDSSLDHLTFNVMNLTNNLSKDNLSINLINSNLSNTSYTLSPSSSNQFKQIINPNFKIQNSPFHKSNQFSHNLVNIVSPINHQQVNQVSPFMQQRTNLIQTVPSINSLLNRSKLIQVRKPQIDQIELDDDARQPKLNSFQETSNAILNSKRMVAERHEPPAQFWRNNSLVNQIVITDVVNDDNLVTIRECKTSQHFFTKSAKKLKKSKLKNLNKVSLKN